MSSVVDPEKHFLGNLLEDDPGSPAVASVAPPFARNNEILSKLTNAGPVMRPVTDPVESSAWPEPPPPYSPRHDWGLSNANTTLTSSSTKPTSWYQFMDHKEASSSELLSSFNLGGCSSSNVAPPTPTHGPLPPSPQIHHFHHNLHHHTHTHNVQVQNHYFGAPPPGLEAYGPRSTATSSTAPQNIVSNTVPLYDSMTPNWSYTGLSNNINANSNSVLFSDWKKENMSNASPEPTVISDSSTSLLSLGSVESEDQEKVVVHLPHLLSPSEIVERAKEKKNISKSYADHLSKTKATAVPPKGIAIGTEKKRKQELAKKMSSQTLGENIENRIHVKGQPHSAPVVSKMPFSYRDVAARVEHHSGAGHAVQHHEEIVTSQQERKDKAPVDAKSINNTKAAPAKINESPQHQSNKEANEKKSENSRKSRADNEFQKINNRKNKKEKNSTVVAAPLIYESVHPVDASSRYDVLKNLESLPAQRNGKKAANGRPPMIQEIFSRSSSPADDMEDTEEEETTRARSASNHAHMNGNNQMKKEPKKRLMQTNQRRRKGRKAEPTWMDNALAGLVEYFFVIAHFVAHCFKWTFELIVEVCLKIADVAQTSFESVYAGTGRGVRKMFIFLFSCLAYFVFSLKKAANIVGSFTLINLLGIVEDFEECQEMEWGCRREIPIPTNATEYADRLSRETIRDAYSVFGLKNDCSDDDIKRNYKRLAALVSPDKCSIEAGEDVFLLVNVAFEAIGTQDSRINYTVENSKDSEMHAKILNTWDKMSKAIEDARNTINCDCNNRHFRVATMIPPAQARYCKRCGIKHPAKQNDIWVEKRNFGFTKAYLTCTDNVVYDISEWATCESQHTMLKNMRAHTHHVQYRLVSPMSNDYDLPSQYFNSSMNYPTSPTDARFLSDLQEEYSSLLRQRSLAQISFKTCEPREEDRSRRAANRRQKRWR